MTTLTDSATFFGKVQQSLIQAKNEGPTMLGMEMLQLGADLMGSAEFDALPPGAKDDLRALYGEAYKRHSGALAL